MTIRLRLRIAAALIVVSVVVFTAVELLLLVNLQHQAAVRSQTRIIEHAIGEVASDLHDAESGQRGYLLTHRERYLTPYHAAVARVDHDLVILERVAAVRPEGSAQVSELEGIVHDKFDELSATVGLESAGKHALALALVLTNRGQSDSEHALALLGTMRADQAATERALEERVGFLRLFSLWVLAFGGPIIVVLVLVLTRSAAASIALSIEVLRARAVSISSEQADGLAAALPNDELGDVARAFDATARRLAEERAKREAVEDELRERNAELVDQRQRADVMRMLSYRLSGCATQDELVRVVTRFMPRLLPNRVGALYVLGNSRRLLVQLAGWGGTSLSRTEFVPNDCWAVRRGQAHVVGDAESDVLCAHVESDPQLRYACIPLTTLGETVGLLHLETRDVETTVAEGDASVLGETIGMALGNLRLRESLEFQSLRDPLTGLFNRRYLEEAWEIESARARREGRSIAVLMIDVDHFKRFNDRFGHEAGDQVLKHVAEALQQQTRDGDIVGRFGGEEFVVLLPGVTQPDAAARAEALRIAVKRLNLQHGAERLGAVTISIGVASYPELGVSFAGVIGAADDAMYRAKGAGRDRVELARLPEPVAG